MSSSISNFKTFLIRFLVPAFIAIAIFCLGMDFVFNKYIILGTQSSGAYKIYRNLHVNSPNEIPIFGSSRASGSYIPDLLDTNCFNYGIEKTQFNLLEVFLENELSRRKNTPIIINFDYEIWADWIGDIGYYIPNIENKQVKKYLGKNDKLWYHVPGMRYYGFYQHYLKGYLGNRSKKNLLNKGGFFLLEKNHSGQLQVEIQARLKTPFEWTLSSQKSERLTRLLTRTKRKIFIVVAPYHNSYFRSFSNYAQADAYLESLKKLPNVYVLNYGKAPYEDSLFKNTTHLNYEGAKRFSAELREELHKLDTLNFSNVKSSSAVDLLSAN